MAQLLTRYRTISGKIVCETGLRIGGSTENIEIGGMENPIIRHPITDEPYIPGSSLKGKVRSLLEYKRGRRDSRGQPKGQAGRDNGEPCECGRCEICRVFGPHKNPRHELGPTRALFRDAVLTPESRDVLLEAQSKGIVFAEVKTENLVNRLTGTAEHPRTQERVPADTEFAFEISVRVFEEDDEDEVMGLLEQGLDLLQQDYLGSSGSRGYGKVRLEYQVT
ncbi:MAG: type III-A CRISPR-associated RAMP protein Csm3 [Anaerolineae bacterium]|jgi:CRISPR-associated protein Csm3